ncbi:MAG: hypothetical protein U0271_22240 [Polyangiaceae bacterium]
MRVLKQSLGLGVLLPVFAIGSAACGSTVIVSGDCLYQGETHSVGESFPAGDDCNTCTCESDGSVSCTELACPISCDDPPPACGAEPGDSGCITSVECTDAGWQCVQDCSCVDAPPIDCEAPPMGCYWNGPICQDGQWTCGDLICQGCASDPPVCDAPPDPNCWTSVVCDNTGNWTCVVECSNDCGPPIPCPEDPDPNCTTQAQCGPDGTWQCVTDCVAGTCEEMYPGGYDVLIAAIVHSCGCSPQSPCAAQCANSGACAMPSLDGVCGQCVIDVANNGDQCVQDGAFGAECQQDAQCSAYVNCLLQQQ